MGGKVVSVEISDVCHDEVQTGVRADLWCWSKTASGMVITSSDCLQRIGETIPKGTNIILQHFGLRVTYPWVCVTRGKGQEMVRNDLFPAIWGPRPRRDNHVFQIITD